MVRPLAHTRALLVLASALLVSRAAISKESKPGARTLAEIEAQVKLLGQNNGATTKVEAKVDAFYKWLGLSAACPAGECKAFVSSSWVTANLDQDGDDERVLAIITRSASAKSPSGPCPSASVEIIVLDSTPSGWAPAAHRSLVFAGGAAPIVDVAAVALHSPKWKDLVVRVEGQCDDASRDRRALFLTFEQGKLEELATSTDYVGNDLASHKVVGAAPATIELNHAKGTTKLFYDELAYAYDALPGYDEATKASVSKDDDLTLSMKECAGPLTPALVSDCGLEGSGKIQVIVQNGKPLGLTVTSTPARPSFVRCTRKKLASTTWKSVPGATGCSKSFALK